MTSYLASLSTHYTSLRRLLPTSLSEETDLHITNPNDSHVSRVLRAYYTEKGRPFPEWLGPDPNQSSRPALSSTASSISNISNSSGSLRTQRNGPTGLGDLFADSPPSTSNRLEAEPLSLRQRRPGVRSPGFKGGSSDSIPYPQKVAQAPPSSSQPNVRPLPSQRAGSYQMRQATPPGSFSNPPPSTISSNLAGRAEVSVQERLKARLGGRSGSPSFNSANSIPSPSPAATYNPTASTTISSSSSSSKPYTSASSPWVSGEDYNSINYGSGGGYPARNTDGSGSGQSDSLRRGKPGFPNGPRPR